VKLLPADRRALGRKFRRKRFRALTAVDGGVFIRGDPWSRGDASMRAPGSYYPPGRTNHDGGAGPQLHGPGGAPQQGINVAPMAAPVGSGQYGCTGCPQVTASSVLHNLDNSALPQPAPHVQSAFEMLGKTPVAGLTHERVDKDDVMMKALLAAISGDKKMLPPWNGSVETLRAWLRQLSLWELDNNLPKSRWGLKLMQSFHEGTAPRRIAEAIDLATLTSESGYSAILSSLMAKYAPYLEASGPAAVENFFYGNERSKNESFSTYIAAKEIALQEMESQLGEKLSPKIAGRILLRHAGLNDLQRENLAVRYNALLTFDQAAAALRPLDRPEALMSRVAKTYVTSTQVDGELEDEQTNEDDDELQPDEDELSGPESDGRGNFTYMLFDPEQEYDEDEANYVWAYNSAYKDVRKELQECPKRAQESAANFFVCQGSSGNQNKVYVNISEAKEKKFSVFAGVQTSGNEAVVDTAAEEAVIGSAAMAKLRQCLESYGLKPAPAHGATVTCAGIGGSAKILGIYDVPVGVARTNGLIRVTEISDEGSFCTPFLLPISYIELVGATVDVSKELFTLKNGNSTPMRRSPSGHRAISVLEFAGKWTLPQQLLNELKIEGENPFQAASPKPSPAKSSTSTKFAQRPGVAVWLKTAQHQLQYMGKHAAASNAAYTNAVLCNSLHWIVLQQKADRPQTPRELKIPLRPNLDLVSFGRAMQKRVTQWLLAQNEDMPDPVPKKKSPPEKLMQAWRRMVLATIRLYLEVMLQSVTDYLTSRNRGTMAKLPKAKKDKSLVPAESKKTAKVRRGIGQPLPRSKACKSWPKEPLDCAHEESQLRQRGSKDSFWWTCLQCGSRWQRVEWEPDMELNAGAASSGEYRGSAGTEKIQTSSKVAYPSRLPPPRSRPNLTTLVVEEETVVRTDPLMAHEGRMTPAPMQSEVQLPMPLEHPQNRHRQAAMGIPPTTSLVTDMAAQALMDGMDFDPTDQTADQQLEKLMAEHKKERRKQMQMASGVRPAQPRSKSRGPASSELEIQEIHTSDDETTPRKAIQDFQMATKLAMFATVLVCSQLPDAEQRISTLLGPRMEFEDSYSTEGDLGIKEMTFSLNASTSELARTDFDGVPKTIDKQQRQHVSFALRNYLDHIGEIYSPPRATAMSPGEGLRGKIALDLTNGWDFCKSEHRQKAVKLVKTHKPAVLLLSPPCGPFSSLRNLSNSKRDSEQVRREVIEGELHMNFAISLAMLQISEGRGFILEQPKNAKSWKLPKMLELLDHPDVYQIRVDMCQFGLRAQAGPCKGELVQKPTLLATNIAEMAHYVQKTCNKSHQHGMLVGGSAKMAAIYTPHFVKALLHGIKNALGIKAAKPQNPQLHQAFLYGKSIGIQAQIFAVDCQEANMDFAMASNSHPQSLDFQADGLRQVVGFGLEPPARPNAEASGLHPSNGLSRMVWPAAADDEDLPEAVVPEAVDDEVLEETRRQLRNVGEQPGVSKALAKMEDFKKVDEGEFSLPPNLRREVHRVHRNLGHPGLDIFVRALQNAGVQEHIIQWTKRHFRCPTCNALPRPKPARPGHLMRALEFNTVVGIDLCFLDLQHKQVILLNMLCWGTNFQQACICQSKNADEVVERFMSEWVKHYGPPVLLVMDRGKEFDNDKLKELVGGLGVGLHYTDAQSPWQNSRTEKAGGILKEKILATIHATSASMEELPYVISEVVAGRNRYMDRFGFSPMQRVFGKNLRLPASLLATDALNRELADASATDPIHRSWEIRDAAAREWIRKQDQGAVRRSLRAQTRTSDQQKIPAGSWVYVFRDTPSYKGWIGPGVTIAEDSTGKSSWVSMRGRLWKASREQLRLATPEEELGAELIVELSKEMLAKLSKPGHVVYQDVTQEGGPTDDYYDEVLRTLNVREEGAQQTETQDGSSQSGDATTSTTTSTTGSSSGQAHMEVDTEVDGSNVTTAPNSELPSRRASIASETGVPTAPMEVIPEVSEPASPVSMPPQPMLPARTFGPSAVERQRHSAPYPAARPRAPAQEPLLDQPETPTLRQSSVTGPTPTLSQRSVTEAAPRTPFPFNPGAPSLPRPPNQSLYVEVINFEDDSHLFSAVQAPAFIGATWKFCREQQRSTLRPCTEDEATFSCQQAEASYCIRDSCMYVTKTKSSFGQVEFSKLPEEEKRMFRASRKKELDSLVSTGAVRILSVEESLRFLRDTPEQVIDSKYVDRYKPIAVSKGKLEEYKSKALTQGHFKAIELEADATNPKSRLCAVGWQDPQILEVERSSPTPLSTSLYACLQLASSRRWATRVKDVKTAFLQALPTTRSKPLACRMPRDECPEGLDPRQLLLLLTEIYGLVTGPSWWRRTLLKTATEKLKYEVNCYDRCILTLPAEESKRGSPGALSDGFIVIEVDDIAEAGGPRHLEKMKQLESMLTFGKVENLQSAEGTNYAGRHLRQLPDFSFEITMEEFIYTRLEPILSHKKVLKKHAAETQLNESEKTQLRGLIASLNWVSREGRPDASSAASILASSFPNPTMEHVHAANEVVKHLKTFPVTLRIHAIPESQLRLVLIADSAFDTSGREKSQHGWLLGFTNPLLNRGEPAPISLIQWRSKRLRRKASSSLLCEAISMSAATGALERLDAFFQSTRLSDYSPRRKQLSEDQYLEAAGKATVIANDSNIYRDPHSVCVMDAKSLYDALNSEQSQGDDDRSALETAIIRESMSVCRSRPRWIPHNMNPADSMTKFVGGHHEPLLKLLKTGKFMIEEEEEVLLRGKQSEQRLKT
ncbi:unnamed protein product, partial [Cladocopium goreaui]